MPRPIGINIRDQHVNEVRAAMKHALGLDREGNDGDLQRFIRSHIREAVLKYRESQQPDIDRTDPTED